MAAKTWSRTVGDANWNTAANWNGGTVPATTDVVTFDGTSVLACTVNALGTFTGQIIVAAGYTGGTAIITQNVAIPSTAAFSIADGQWIQAAAITRTTFAVTGGTFTGGSQSITLSGTLTFSGGTLTMTSGTCTISTGSFTQTNTPTFNANGGTIAFTGGTAATLTGPNCTFNLITFTKTNVAFTVAAGTTCPLGTGPTDSCGTGAFTINGTVTWTDRLTLTGSMTTIATTTITVSGAKELHISRGLTFHASATITTLLPVKFTLAVDSTVTATAYTFGTCSTSLGLASNLVVAASTTVPLGANPTVGALTIDGTVTASGVFTFDGQNNGLTLFNATGTLSGTFTRIVINHGITINAAFTMQSGLPFTWYGNGTVTATSYTFGTCQLDKGINIAAGTTIPLGANPVSAMGADQLTINGTITFTGIYDLSGCTSLNFSATTVLSGDMTFFLQGAGADFSCNAAATFGNLRFVINAGMIFAGAGKTFVSLTKVATGTGAVAGTVTMTGANTFTDGIYDLTAGMVNAHTWIFPNTTTTVGTFRFTGAAGKLITLQRTGGAGTFTLHATGAAVISCTFISVSNSTVDVSPIWYAGASSTNGGGNTNWVFQNSPTIAKQKKTIFKVMT